MRNKKNLKKQIIYRSTHRGTKEMDILLGNFVKKNIDKFSHEELYDLGEILNYEDEALYKCYFDKNQNKSIENNKIMKMLKEFNFYWRRGWDSNPRMGCPIAGFQDQCFQPLSHPSKDLVVKSLIYL